MAYGEIDEHLAEFRSQLFLLCRGRQQELMKDVVRVLSQPLTSPQHPLSPPTS